MPSIIHQIPASQEHLEIPWSRSPFWTVIGTGLLSNILFQKDQVTPLFHQTTKPNYFFERVIRNTNFLGRLLNVYSFFPTESFGAWAATYTVRLSSATNIFTCFLFYPWGMKQLFRGKQLFHGKQSFYEK